MASYSYTGTIQTYTSSISGVATVVATAGGGGGGGNSGQGGSGQIATGTFSVVGGITYYILVGQGGVYPSGGTGGGTSYGGGGSGGSATFGAGGGGGMTWISTDSTFDSSVIIVSGAGGGGGQNSAIGGDGGYTTGGSGSVWTGYIAATGGSQIAGGSAGSGPVNSGTSGGFGSGGSGGGTGNSNSYGGGGGGGGYYGGGGGGAGQGSGSPTGTDGGGGGGSSYFASGVTSTSTSSAGNGGNGTTGGNGSLTLTFSALPDTFSTNDSVIESEIIFTNGPLKRILSTDLEAISDFPSLHIPNSQPIITFRESIFPYNLIPSPFIYSETIANQSGLPILSGDYSDMITFRIYNNFGLQQDIGTAYNLSVTTYDNTSHYGSSPLVTQEWVSLQENGYGQNSTTANVFTFYQDSLVFVGGASNVKSFTIGADGSFGSNISAGSNRDGCGFIEVKTFCWIPAGTSTGIWSAVLTANFDWTT